MCHNYSFFPEEGIFLSFVGKSETDRGPLGSVKSLISGHETLGWCNYEGQWLLISLQGNL